MRATTGRRSPIRQAADVLSDKELSDALDLWYQARVIDHPAPVVHLLTASAPLSDLTTDCCRQHISDLPGSDRGTSDPAKVTCGVRAECGARLVYRTVQVCAKPRGHDGYHQARYGGRWDVSWADTAQGAEPAALGAP